MKNKPIRVLQVFAGLGRGGAETMIMNYYRKIDREKVQFDFVVRTKERLAYEDEIESLGGRIYHVAEFKLYNILLLIKQAKKIFSNTDYKIVHGHIIETALFIFIEAYRIGVKTIIAHFHSTSYRSSVFRILKLIIFYFQKRIITDYFACGKKAVIFFLGNKVASKATLLPNAIDTNRFVFSNIKRNEIRNGMSWNDKFVVINVARFCAVKNHSFLLDIFNQITNQNPNSLLVLIGGHGELESAIRKKVKMLNLNNKVQFLGERNDVDNLLQGADLFLLPSLYEGLPVSLIEAQASGLKIVTSTGVPKEVAITKDLVEFLSLKENAEYWAEYSLNVLKNFKRTDRYNEIVEANFDITKNAEWLQNYYLEKAKR